MSQPFDSRAPEAGAAPAARDPRPGPVADAQTLLVLEFARLLELVAGQAMSPLGRERVLGLRPCADISLVLMRQRRLSQVRALIAEQGRPGLDGLIDLRPLLGRLAVDGAYLLPEELERVADFLGAAERAAQFLAAGAERFDEVNRLHNRITPLPEVGKRIRQIVGPGHSVASSASPELGRLRRDLARSRDSLRGQLMALMGREEMGSVFSDQIVTQRSDRFVVPVRNDARGRVQGIIHDTSATGATCFMEPLEAIEGNNQLSLLRRQELEEEERILIEAARTLALHLQVLQEDLAALAQLDCLLAQALFAEALDCAEPALNLKGEIDLLHARHPLLAWRGRGGRGLAAPINLGLNPQARVLVISGANAGGKTASLKTVGLLTLMAMCGLQVPADQGSRLAVFGKLLAEIGDEQDLTGDKSTFTAHAGRLAEMVNQAGRDTLALIDELGGGTDPGEGAALGIAVLDWLKQRGASVLVTTHFHRLKAYAATTEGVENVSVAFDPLTGRPTYQLHYGLPGFSDALTVSRSLGFPPALVEAARRQVDQAEEQTVALMRQVEEARQQAEAAQAAAQAERLKAAEEREEAKRLLNQAKKERAGALSEGKRRVREVARRMERRLEELYGQVAQAKEQGQAPKPGTVKQQVYEARREALNEVEAVAAPPEQAAQPKTGFDPRRLKAGDAVHLLALDQRGVLLEDPKPGAESAPVSVGVAGVRVVVPLREMEALPAGAKTAPPPRPAVSVQASAGDGLDLNLVGLTVDEALPKVDKALDQAILAGKANLAIIHGVGSGRLKAAVRDYLEHHPFVTATHRPEGRRGGAGVTVAELRS